MTKEEGIKKLENAYGLILDVSESIEKWSEDECNKDLYELCWGIVSTMTILRRYTDDMKKVDENDFGIGEFE